MRISAIPALNRGLVWRLPGQRPLVTVAEFERLPELASGHYEVHHGEVLLVSPPEA